MFDSLARANYIFVTDGRIIKNYILVYLFPEIGNKIRKILHNCWIKIYHPVMTVANLLDPFYLGKDLSIDGMMIISNFIHQYYPHTMNIIWEQLL